MFKKILKNIKGAASFIALIIVLGLTITAAIVFSNYFKNTFNNTIDNAENAFDTDNTGGGSVVSPDEGDGNDENEDITTSSSNLYITFESPNSFTLNTYNKNANWDGKLEYSKDLNTWYPWYGTEIQSENNKLYLRGTGNTKITGNSSNYRWVLNGENISCSGNIETLLDYQTVENGGHPVMSNYCYSRMFDYCTSLVETPELPATTLADSCYSYMFWNCTSLTEAPELPATTLADSCYYYMFERCTSLEVAPELPATTLADYCYRSMFQGCTSLVEAPELPATTLADYCYRYMFYGCTSLKVSTENIGEYQYAWSIPSNTTTASNWNFGMFSSTGGTFTGDPEVGVTYYLAYPPVGYEKSHGEIIGQISGDKTAVRFIGTISLDEISDPEKVNFQLELVYQDKSKVYDIQNVYKESTEYNDIKSVSANDLNCDYLMVVTITGVPENVTFKATMIIDGVRYTTYTVSNA